MGKTDSPLEPVAAGKHTCHMPNSVSTGKFSVPGTTVRMFTTEEIKAITDNYFAEKIGKGAFGRVFRGTYHHTEVAMKVLRKVNIVVVVNIIYIYI